MESAKKIIPFILVAVIFAVGGYFVGSSKLDNQGASLYTSKTITGNGSALLAKSGGATPANSSVWGAFCLLTGGSYNEATDTCKWKQIIGVVGANGVVTNISSTNVAGYTQACSSTGGKVSGTGASLECNTSGTALKTFSKTALQTSLSAKQKDALGSLSLANQGGSTAGSFAFWFSVCSFFDGLVTVDANGFASCEMLREVPITQAIK